MPTFDQAHAQFVLKEHRLKTVSTPAVKAKNSAARSVEILTSTNEANALRIANAVLASNVNPRVFDVTVSGAVSPDLLIGGPLNFIPDFTQHKTDGREMRAVSLSVDWDAETSSFQVRG